MVGEGCKIDGIRNKLVSKAWIRICKVVSPRIELGSRV